MWKKPVLARVKGSSHEKSGQACQDYGHCEFLDDQCSIIAGAIADGMGSAKHSDKGSKLAVKTALSFLKSEKIPPQTWLEEFSKEKATETFRALVTNVHTTLKQEAKNKQYSLHDLACTLLVFVATSKNIMAMQVGDGFIVIRSANTKNYTLLFQPHQDGAIDVTASITSSQAIKEMQVCVIDDVCDFICSGTDGLEDIALEFKRVTECKPFDNFLELTRNLVISTEEKEAKKRIENFLDSDKVRRKSDDDKTLLVCVRPDDVSSELSIDAGKTQEACSDSDNSSDSHGTENKVSEDDSSSPLVNNTSNEQDKKQSKEVQLPKFLRQINDNLSSDNWELSTNPDVNDFQNLNRDNQSSQKKNNISQQDNNNGEILNDDDNDTNNSLTSVPQQTKTQEKTQETDGETKTKLNKDKWKGLSIALNLLTIPLIFFLLYKPKQPVIPIYTIPNLNIPNTEQWVIISGDRLNQTEKKFTVEKKDFAPAYRSLIVPKDPNLNYPVEYLQPNIYSYTETQPFELGISNNNRQWVKIENSPSSLSAWAIASIDHLNTREMSFTVEESDLRVIYRGDWTPSNKPDSKYRLGELPPGTYRYTEIKPFDTKMGEKRRWVKIQIKKP